MKSADNSSDQIDANEFVGISLRADDGDSLQPNYYHGDIGAASDQLDLEVTHFLETESYPQDTAMRAKSLLLQSQDIPDDTFLEEELVLLGLNESIDVPDLDFSDFTMASKPEVHLDSPQSAVKDEPMETSTQAVRRITAPPEKRLRVIIPASALMTPDPSHHRDLPVQPAPSQQRKTTNSRKRVKDELEYLRLQAKELEDKLRQLQQSSPVATGGTPRQNESSQADETSHAFLWKRIAEHQMDQKRKSEVENARLKEQLEGQLKITQSLSKAIQKRPDLTWLESTSSEVAPGHFDSLNDSKGIFDLLALQLDSLHARADSVFADCDFVNPQSEIREGQVKTDSDNRIYLEILDCNIIPFGLQATNAGVWKLLSLPSLKVTNGVFQAVETTDGIFRAKLTVTLRLRHSEAELHIRMVGKRIVETNRVVLVWNSMGESKGSLFGNERIVIRENGWTILQEVPSLPVSQDASPSAHDTKFTSVQTVVRMTPELENSSANASHVGTLTDLLFGSFHQNLSMMHQMVENIILAESLAREL
ncbi:hypothetical protein FI667_g9352, partial [Globisporangium splendens]